MSLSNAHRRELRQSALADKHLTMLEAQGWRTDEHSALVIPYLNPEGRPYEYQADEFAEQAIWREFRRWKPDRKGEDGPKYLCPKGSRNFPYWPVLLPRPQLHTRLQKRLPLIITEGEKKAEALAAHYGRDYLVMGLAGIDCWRKKDAEGKSRVLPELEAVNWNRSVYICFDSDMFDIAKPQIQEAAGRLATWLAQQGARVLILRIYGEADRRRNGVDDWLVRHGTESLWRLLEAEEEWVVRHKGEQVLRCRLKPHPPVVVKSIILYELLKSRYTVQPNGNYYEWKKTHWEIVATQFGGFPLALPMMKVMEALKFNNRDVSYVSAVRNDLTHRFGLYSEPWRESHKYVALNNGTLHLETGEFRKGHDRSHGLQNVFPFDWIEDPNPSQWFDFLDFVSGGDLDMVYLLQAICRVLITPLEHDKRNPCEKIFVLQGPPGSGKGTFLRVLEQLIGVDNVGDSSPQTLAEPTGLFDLTLRTVGMCPDASGRITNVGLLNRIASNERVVVKRLYHQEYSTTLDCQIVWACNDIPTPVGGGKVGLDRRLLVVPFKERPKQIDIELDNKLFGEIPAIFRWAMALPLAAALEQILQAAVPEKPKTVKAVVTAVREAKLERAPVERWLNEAFENGFTDRPARELYRAYSEWASEQGLAAMAMAPTWGRAMKAVEGTKTLHRRHGNLWTWAGAPGQVD